MQRTEINPAPTFRVPRAKGLNRPSTWFSKSSASASSASSSSSSTPTINSAFASTSAAASPSHNPFANPNVFSTKGKHRLSPSPSPHALRQDEDFVMISPVRPSITGIGRDGSSSGGSGSSPIEESPTPACGMASATARLKLGDDDSPIRRIPGQSRSLRAGPSLFVQTTKATPASPLKYSTNALALSDGETSPQLPETPLGECLPPQPLFPLRSSQSQECASSKAVFTTSNGSKSIRIDDRPRMNAPHPTRARSSTDAEQRIPMLGQKKAISLDAIPLSVDKDETFGSSLALNTGKKNRPSSSATASRDGRAHKRINSSEYRNPASISRSFGLKSGLALSLSPGLPDFSSSNSSLSSLSTNNMTPPASAFSPAEPPIFEDVKPLQEAFEQPSGTVSRKFKPRDSGVSMGGNDDRLPPPSVLKVNTNVRPRRPAMLKRTSSMGDEFRQDCETPGIGPAMGAAWPGPGAFDFLGDGALAIGMGSNDGKISMPGTPVKKQAFTTHRGMGHSHSQPTLASDAFDADDKVPPSTQKLPPSVRRATAIPHLTLTTTSSPDSPNAMDTDHSSPTVHLGNPMIGANEDKPTRVGMLRPNNGASETSEDEGTPTKGGGERLSLAMGSQVTPTPSPRSALKTKPNFANLPISTPHLGGPIMPRLSLPAFAAPKLHRTLHHRQSHPAPATLAAEEDVFERRFITLETLGKGAFSTVVKVQERYGEGLWAVKKARGVFDGVRDRLRHLEEVDILRHLSKTPCDHVVQFEDAWEQNRQLFIQTELCLGSLAFFLEEYGRVVERLDEGRVWKIVRELSDGINHIHSNGVIHFDIKPANILISSTGSLKIGDFGLATRWPRVDPIEILQGSGLGGSAIHMSQSTVGTQAGRLEREGDRDYMPPEMLRGVFVMAADIFSFGLVILEVSTNICVPDGGAPWHALRSDDFSVVDLSPLSPALVDLITSCMRASPDQRPRIGHVVSHPVVQRARRRGKNALAPEDPRWLVDILSGGSGMSDGFGQVGDGDVEMLDS